jgi:UDP-N-acetylmuramoyl-L-alanyl-D-glutamate--2,6-diaminopimelate ligase
MLPESLLATITDITDDSRQVTTGALYVSMQGDYIEQAIAKGAIAVVAPKGTKQSSIPVYEVEDPRATLAELCARFFQPRPATIVAVTGTDGKTSVAHFCRQLWERVGCAAVSLGTIGVRGKAAGSLGSESLTNTTPGMVALSKMLQQLALQGVTHVAMEASSHGLDQKRMDGIALKVAAFTNFTRDHLDYHGTLEAYFAAKARLFTTLLPAGGIAVLNAEDAKVVSLAEACPHLKIWRCGAVAGAELQLVEYRPDAAGAEITLQCFGQQQTMHVPLLGRFQVSNLLTAMALVHASGVPMQPLLEALPTLEGVPGRLQTATHTKKGSAVLVDYAHTPAALENMLGAVRAHVTGRLIVVFGCGGDRDAGKRPLMGAAAARCAEVVIVTDDNPRSEEPGAIRRAVLSGIPAGVDVLEIGDRQQAIATAIAQAQQGEVVVIAGKGHEKEQIIGDQRLPFDDVDIARRAAA